MPVSLVEIMFPGRPFTNGYCHRSAIIHPEDKQVIIHGGKIALEGWAYSGGGNWVERVEVSPDG